MKGYLTDQEAREKYGDKTFDEMIKTGYLDAITVLITEGTVYTPERDYDLAYKVVTGRRLHPEEWD